MMEITESYQISDRNSYVVTLTHTPLGSRETSTVATYVGTGRSGVDRTLAEVMDHLHGYRASLEALEEHLDRIQRRIHDNGVMLVEAIKGDASPLDDDMLQLAWSIQEDTNRVEALKKDLVRTTAWDDVVNGVRAGTFNPEAAASTDLKQMLALYNQNITTVGDSIWYLLFDDPEWLERHHVVITGVKVY